MNPDAWLLKIAAFLYDIPEKAIRHGKRDDWWADHFKTLTGADASTVKEAVTRAHRLAASADRFSLGDRLGKGTKGAIAVEFLADPLALHPLSAQANPWVGGAARQLGSLPDIDSDDASRNPAFQAVEKCLKAIKGAFTDHRKQFLALWRLLPEWLPQAHRAIPSLLWDHLPADTRTPDHTVRDAELAASTIVTALPEPAFLLFSFGPIQPFIKTSRRTQDFWMGSLLLSWLSWQAIKAVAETYGPDTIIYPDLYRQPFVDRWLKEEEGLNVDKVFTTEWATEQEDLAISSFPTRFLAILPKAGAERIVQCARKKLEAEWRAIAGAVKTKMEALDIPGLVTANSIWAQLWNQQALRRSPFECRWVVLPWQADGARCVEMGRQWMELQEQTRRLYETLQENLPAERFYPTHTYGLLYDLLALGHASRKRLHAFEQMAEECGEKCTLCGERDALRPEGADRLGLRDFWTNVAKKVPGHIALDGEMLCAVCLTRRMAGKFYDTFHRVMDLDYHFTSTSGIAAAPFQEALMQAGLTDKAQALTDALKRLPEPLFRQLPGECDAAGQRKFRAYPVPKVSQQATADPWKEFVQVDGEWLYEEAFDRHLMRMATDNGQKQIVRRAQESLTVLRPAAGRQGIAPPSPYFAVLYFDGDEMGKWLGGEKAPLIGEILHPQSAMGLLGAAASGTTAARGVLPIYEALKDLRRPMGPALHRAMSAALRNFALEIARTVVEGQHRGRLIYAGGDELLALLPLEDALPAAWTLRRLWSGEAFARDGLIGLAGFVERNGRLLTLMGGATASVGIAYAHYLFPLGLVIEAAYRTADDEAKEALGRDALGVTIIKRSGERIETGARWWYGGMATVSTVANLARALDPLDPQGGFLSRRLVYQLRALSPTFQSLDVEAQTTLLEQQIDRHVSPKEKAKADALKGPLRSLLRSLHEQRPASDKRAPFERFLDLLFFAEFLGSRGGRG